MKDIFISVLGGIAYEALFLATFSVLYLFGTMIVKAPINLVWRVLIGSVFVYLLAKIVIKIIK